jgi:hypothetical protein
LTIALSKKHEGIYDNDDVFNESPPSKESIQKETEHQEKTQNEIKESAKELDKVDTINCTSWLLL